MSRSSRPFRPTGETSSGRSDSLAGAVAASRLLPAGQGAALLYDARHAFTAGLHVTALVAAAIFAGLAVLILVMRQAPAGDLAPVAAPVALPDDEAAEGASAGAAIHKSYCTVRVMLLASCHETRTQLFEL